MHWEKEIRIRITLRRIVGAILTATTVVNLVIVGVMFEVASASVSPTLTPLLITPSATITLIAPTSTDRGTFTPTLASTSTPTQTSSATPTYTLTPTDTQTIPPSPTPCKPWYSWPIYIIQRGDTLSGIARATGSSIGELMLANCLTDNLIFAGQSLYVPRLPINPPTSTPTFTPSPTPSITPSDTPTFMTPPSPSDSPGQLHDQRGSGLPHPTSRSLV